MLAKKHRLIKKEDREEVFRSGARAGGQSLSLWAKKTTNAFPRVSFIVGHKVAKKAVMRNRVKRQLRASFGRHTKQIRAGLDIIVVPTPEIIHKKFSDIHEEVTRLLTKAHIIGD